MSTIWGDYMKKIIKFKSGRAVKAYCEKKAIKTLGSGSEGTCYLGSDGLAYKDMSEGYPSEEYEIRNIITTGDYQNKSFNFPHVLFVVDGELMGYTSDAVTRSLADRDYIFNNGINHIDFDKLYQAYKIMYQDEIQLANDGICIYDLPHNVIFDGERLIGIDTCGYYRAPVKECLRNTDSVDAAVKYLFAHYAEYIHHDKLDMDLDVKEFLDVVKSRYSTSGSKKPYIKK